MREIQTQFRSDNWNVIVIGALNLWIPLAMALIICRFYVSYADKELQLCQLKILA